MPRNLLLFWHLLPGFSIRFEVGLNRFARSALCRLDILAASNDRQIRHLDRKSGLGLFQH